MARYFRILKWVILSLVMLTLVAFFHYVLPQHDVVRITDTSTQRIDMGENSLFWAAADSGTDATQTTRDVKFIATIQPNGKPMVYRNEDTGWIWPPYFKFDSYNVQAEASDLKSTAEAPKWVMVTHYGWRNEWFTIFPNAVSVKAVAGPDVTVFPWVNIIILSGLLAILFMLWRMWAQFKERTIDPTIDAVDARADAMADSARGFGGRISAWLGTWRAKPRK
jgi:hypothetical protein